MPHIVIIPYNIASKLNPAFELARRLQKNGHRISIIGESALKPIAEFQRMPFIVSDEMEAFPKMLTDLNPDIVLIDDESHEAIISAVPTGIPIVLISTFFSLFKCSGLPPLHKGVIPGIGFEGSIIGIEYLWLRYRLGKWRKRFRQRKKKKGSDQISVLRRHAKRAGFDFRTEVDLNQWMTPFVYRNLPLLSFVTHEFDFPHTPLPHHYHVGPMINVDRIEVVKTDENKINSLLSEHRNNATQNKLIYCSFGAYFKGDDKGFLIKLIGALAENTSWKVILGLGGRLESSSLGRPPSNIFVFNWVPQLRVLKFADCAIIHGGISSINECIALGVPMLVFPFNINDQHGNAARVAYHHVGIVGERNNDDSMEIRRNVETLLNDTKYASNVLQMCSYFNRDRKKNKAVKTIEFMMDRSKKKSSQ